MDKIKLTLENENCSAVNIGALTDLAQHSWLHPKLNIPVNGKVFVGEMLKTTSMETSFQIMPPKVEMSFFHIHEENEELYIFLKGKGQFQVDEDVFDIEEGSVVRVAPKGRRTWKNNSDEPMILIVVQAKENSLNKFNVTDGSRL